MKSFLISGRHVISRPIHTRIPASSEAKAAEWIKTHYKRTDPDTLEVCIESITEVTKESDR